jgi:hypothetical protein
MIALCVDPIASFCRATISLKAAFSDRNASKQQQQAAL